MPKRPARVVQVDGPVTLQFPDGFRIQVTAQGRGAAGAGRRGRKPSPATVALIEAMHRDHGAGAPRSRADYLEVLRKAGHKGSPQSASIILSREARRVFGSTLGRGGARRPRAQGRRRTRGGTGRGRGRPASAATSAIREKLAKDKADGSLHEAAHYVRWLVDKADVGIKQARPIVYRELRAVR
jgi:hypothetical protein